MAAGRPPVRRRVDTGATPQDTSGRTGCILVGAFLGVAAGVLVAFFVLPGVFRSFFGTADVFLGEAYNEEGRSIAVVEVRRVPGADGAEFPGVFEVLLDVRASRTWEPGPADFELELTAGPRLRLLPPDPSLPETSLDMPLGQSRQVLLRFAGSERRDAVPKALHIAEPRVRFLLEGRSKD
jgi:hypothetical protein